MRELKFRAYDTQAKCMLGGGGMQINATTGKLDHLPSVIVMQYIGIRDKKGRDGYFDDLVKWGKSLWQVELNDLNGQTILTKRSGNEVWSHLPIIELGGGEIIGNIWENPELIKIKGG